VFAAHFAAGLALKGRVPRAPTLALLIGCVIPDFVWIVLAYRRIEPTALSVFFDDWSHSLATVALMATLFSASFWRYGRAAVLAIWTAVVSHFILDLPIHPRFLALYPHSGIHMGVFLSGTLGARKYWWTQLAVVFVLTLVYIHGARRARVPSNLIAATSVLLLGLHLLMFPQ
jgi:hypothetical protein